jgi:acyl-coenzyme A synthetase/AMP-(fatty) acid ligase
LYGQTETTAALGYEKGDERKENSMGKAKYGYDVRVSVLLVTT